ncbi:MAG: class I SAM-dependent methyltransferase [Anaerolineales bacterium]|jgi:23S rRNA (cytosine1962-C5)-methyltransferase|nr:class I SAM-dependent methyltransferase [Anaerolineales bacterium]
MKHEHTDQAAMWLKPGREKSLLRRHPWVFSGAVAQVKNDPAKGATVALRAADGAFLGWAAYNPDSQITARVWSWDEAEQIDAAFFRRRLSGAFAMRQALLPGVQAVRLVHAESDGIPGLVLDRYADTLVAQVLTAGVEFWRSTLADLILELSGCSSLYERSDVEARRLDGLELRTGTWRGAEPPERVGIVENGRQYQVDVRQGHKTGFYLDQRLNRQRVAELAAGRQVLDCFCYTGGFTVSALQGGASQVLAVDASAEALSQAAAHVALNQVEAARVVFQEGDVFQVLRGLRDRRSSFDMIILDPPKFAQSASQVERAARGYKDINLLALKLLRPGGLLVTFSCSGGIDADLFQKIVAGAALDAGVEAQIVERLHQGPDHPVALNFPEGAYLKGFVVRI